MSRRSSLLRLFGAGATRLAAMRHGPTVTQCHRWSPPLAARGVPTDAARLRLFGGYVVAAAGHRAADPAARVAAPFMIASMSGRMDAAKTIHWRDTASLSGGSRLAHGQAVTQQLSLSLFLAGPSVESFAVTRRLPGTRPVERPL